MFEQYINGNLPHLLQYSGVVHYNMEAGSYKKFAKM